MSRIAILGGGSWGTGLAVALGRSRRKHEIRIWVREPTIALGIRERRENPVYLPGCTLPPSVDASTDLQEVLHGAYIVIGVVPSAHARAFAHEPGHRTSLLAPCCSAHGCAFWSILRS